MRPNQAFAKGGLNFEQFEGLSCGKISELSKESKVNCFMEFKQFIGQRKKVITEKESIIYVGAGEMRSASKLERRNSLEANLFTAQDFLEVGNAS
jgi:hypothetical protein